MTTIKLGISQEHAKLFPYVTRFFGVTSQGAPMHVVLLSIDMSFQTLNGVKAAKKITLKKIMVLAKSSKTRKKDFYDQVTLYKRVLYTL
jgi:hypothetical protein